MSKPPVSRSRLKGIYSFTPRTGKKKHSISEKNGLKMTLKTIDTILRCPSGSKRLVILVTSGFMIMHPIWHRVSWHVSSARFRTRWTWQPWLRSSKVEMLFFWGWQMIPLDIQIPPQEKVWMAYFRGPTTFSAGVLAVWMSRVHTLFLHLLLDMASFAQD